MQRGWQDHHVFANEPYTEREAWEWLIGNAAYEDRKRRIGPHVVDVPRGSVVASLRFMQRAWRWKSDARVRNFLSRISIEGMIEVSKNEKQNLTQIALCNYDNFQLPERSENAAKTQPERKLKQINKSSSLRSEDKSSISDAVEMFNLLAVDNGWPKVQAVTERRKSALVSRLKELGGVDGWRELLDRAAKSDFLCGRSQNSYPLKFDWVVNPTNAAKVIEGNYDNRGGPTGRPAPEGFTRDRNGSLVKINNPKPEAARHENRMGNAERGTDRNPDNDDWQSPDDLPRMQPEPEEEIGEVSFGDNRGGRDTSALPPLRMELC